jgi:ABC-type transport system involved in multi-copper enzyme maturation permease subunit
VTLEGAFESFADFAGPMVVKEVRQGLRTRLFAIVLVLVLLGSLLLALTGAASADIRDNAGRDTAQSILFVLCVLELLVLPLWAFRSMSIERERALLPLLLLTPLSGREVLAGKARSASLLGGVLASVMAPFILFTYFLNGVALRELGMALGLVTLAHFLTVRASVSLACLSVSRAGNNMMYVLTLGLLLFSTLVGFGLVSLRDNTVGSFCGACWGFPVLLVATVTFEEATWRLKRAPTLEGA